MSHPHHSTFAPPERGQAKRGRPPVPGAPDDRPTAGGSLSSWSGTGRKLVLGFGTLVLILFVASFFTLAGQRRIHEAMARMQSEEEGVRMALELSSAVRDQYAHQAHTIIIGNESHLGFYTEAQAHVLELTRQLRSRVHGDEERACVDEIEQASAELDTLFRREIVPAVVRGDLPFVRAEHARAQAVVTRIQDRAGDLALTGDLAAVDQRRQRAGNQ